MKLIEPTLDRLPAYAEALRRGWSPNTLRPEAAEEELDAIRKDPELFIDNLEDREAKGEPILLPDGSRVPRLPGFRRWIWHEGFCGSISLRWQPETEELPPHCPGHVGYAVVPWRRREGLATAALIALLVEARSTSLRYLELTASPDNPASVKVIEGAGGVYIERFSMGEALGGGEALRFRIGLCTAPHPTAGNDTHGW